MTYGVNSASDRKRFRNREKRRVPLVTAIARKIGMRRLWIQTPNQARVLAEDALNGLREAGYRIIHEDDIEEATDRGW